MTTINHKALRELVEALRVSSAMAIPDLGPDLDGNDLGEALLKLNAVFERYDWAMVEDEIRSGRTVSGHELETDPYIVEMLTLLRSLNSRIPSAPERKSGGQERKKGSGSKASPTKKPRSLKTGSQSRKKEATKKTTPPLGVRKYKKATASHARKR